MWEEAAAARSPPQERDPILYPPGEMTEMPWWGHGIYNVLPLLLFIPIVFLPDPTAQILPPLDPTAQNSSREPIQRPRVAEL